MALPVAQAMVVTETQSGSMSRFIMMTRVRRGRMTRRRTPSQICWERLMLWWERAVAMFSRMEKPMVKSMQTGAV